MIPEITTSALADKLKTDEKFILLDVREQVELGYAKISDSRLEVAPMSQLSEKGQDALSESAQSKDAVIYVLCHHGNRSRQVAMWLSQQGWKNVFNITGGIDDYARRIDRSVGLY